MIKKTINYIALFFLCLQSQQITTANTINKEISNQEDSNSSLTKSIHTLPLNPTFRFSAEEISKKETDISDKLLPLPKQEAKEVSKLVRSTRDPFIHQRINSSNDAINFLKKIKLSGLYQTNKNAFVILKENNGKEYLLKIGQKIGESLKLSRISIDKQFIELTDGSDRYRIKMKI